MERCEEIAKAVEGGFMDKVRQGVQQALAEGISANSILHDGLLKGMNTVAEKFKTGQMFLPEVLAVAGAMKAGMAIVRPLLSVDAARSKGKVVIGTVKGDMHDIGKNLVGIMLEGAGFEVVDLGVNVRTDDFVAAVEREKPHVLGLSALLTTTMGHMRSVIDALDKRQLRDKVKVIIGGAPISRDFAAEIKADGYARDAATAVDLVRSLMKEE